MSRYTVELPKEVAIAWRKFLGSKEGQFGIDWLRRRNRVSGATPTEMLESALKFTGFHEALDEVEDSLTDIPQKQVPIDEPPLETPESR